MNSSKKTIFLAAALVLLLVGGAVGYSFLSERYTPPQDGVVLAPPVASDETVPEKADETEDSPESETAAPSETEEETESPFDPAPDFTVQNTTGEDVKLSDFRGKPVIINFWATWCGPCKSELPAFHDAYAAHGDAVNFLMINVTDGAQDTVEGVTAFVEDNGYVFPLYFDTQLLAAATYGASSIPLTVFVDAKGNLLGGHRGAMDSETLEKYIEILVTYYAEP